MSVIHEFILISQQRMCSHYLPKLEACLEQLDETQLWDIPHSSVNSIGGIVLHTSKLIELYVEIELLNIPSVNNNGIEDYFPSEGFTKKEVSAYIKQVFSLFENELENALTRTKQDINIGKLYHVVEHTGYHLGQIVDRTKLITQASFQFCQNGVNEKSLLHAISDKYR